MFALDHHHLSRRGVHFLTAALFAVVTAARFAFADPTNGVGSFYPIPICLAWVGALAARPSEAVNFENRFRARGGAWHWLSWTARSDGKEIYAVAKEITQRKRAE